MDFLLFKNWPRYAVIYTLFLSFVVEVIFYVLFKNINIELFYLFGTIMGILRFTLLSRIVSYITTAKKSKKSLLIILLYGLIQVMVIVVAFLKLQLDLMLPFLLGFAMISLILYGMVIITLFSKRLVKNLMQH